MKRLALALISLASVAHGQESRTYEHTVSNLKFTIAGPSKLTKKRDDWTIVFPINKTQNATLKVFAVSFMAEPTIWEAAQKYFVEQQRLTMLSQTREELLGAPMLLCRMQETATLERSITISGLVYAANDWKFSFRLTAPESGMADADAKWTEILQTFATIDGRLLSPETPGRTAEAPAGKRKPATSPDLTRTAIRQGASDKPKTVIGPVVAPCQAAGRKLELHAPTGSTLKSDGNDVTLESLDFPGVIRVHAMSSLDAALMKDELARRSSASLDEFKVVKLRTESRPAENLAGASMVVIAREGEAVKGGTLYRIVAGGAKGDFYWIAEYAFAGTPTDKQRAAVLATLNRLSLEIAP